MPIELDEYYDQLVRHDWTYTYSDDNRAFQRGLKEQQRLERIAAQSSEHNELYLEMKTFYLNREGLKPSRPGTPDTTGSDLPEGSSSDTPLSPLQETKDNPPMNTTTKPKEQTAPPAADDKNLPANTGGALSTFDYGEDAGGGFENQTKDDMALPFMSLLQPGSPEVVRSEGVTKPGTFLNKVTGEFWEGKTGFAFIPACTEHCYTQWKKRNQDGSGGGFVARHELDSTLAKLAREKSPFSSYDVGDKGSATGGPLGTELNETFYVFGNLVDEDGLTTPMGLAFGSTHIKAYKSWMYIARSIQVKTPNGGKQNPPLFAHRYRVKSVLSPKSSGSQMWFIPVISFDGPEAEAVRLLPTDPLYLETRQIRDAYQAGTIKADYGKTDESAVAGTGEGTTMGTKAPGTQTKAPF